jgi:hypothetical protein
MTKEKIKRKVGRPSKLDIQRAKEEREKDLIIKGAVIIGLILFIGIFAQNLLADQMTHKFKSPSFSGENTSSHYLTIDNVEYTRRMTIKAEIKALQDEIERDKENTTLARFIRNLESRIYAQLSRQLVEALFGETPSDNGTIELEGNTITYSVVDGIITLTIVDAEGNETIIQIPIGSFTF